MLVMIAYLEHSFRLVRLLKHSDRNDPKAVQVINYCSSSDMSRDHKFQAKHEFEGFKR